MCSCNDCITVKSTQYSSCFCKWRKNERISSISHITTNYLRWIMALYFTAHTRRTFQFQSSIQSQKYVNKQNQTRALVCVCVFSPPQYSFPNWPQQFEKNILFFVYMSVYRPLNYLKTESNWRDCHRFEKLSSGGFTKTTRIQPRENDWNPTFIKYPLKKIAEITRSTEEKTHSPHSHSKREPKKNAPNRINTIAQSFCYHYVEQCVSTWMLFLRIKIHEMKTMLVAAERFFYC